VRHLLPCQLVTPGARFSNMRVSGCCSPRSSGGGDTRQWCFAIAKPSACVAAESGRPLSAGDLEGGAASSASLPSSISLLPELLSASVSDSLSGAAHSSSAVSSARVLATRKSQAVGEPKPESPSAACFEVDQSHTPRCLFCCSVKAATLAGLLSLRAWASVCAGAEGCGGGAATARSQASTRCAATARAASRRCTGLAAACCPTRKAVKRRAWHMPMQQYMPQVPVMEGGQLRRTRPTAQCCRMARFAHQHETCNRAGQYLQASAEGGLPPEVDCDGDVGAVDLVPPPLWYKYCVTCLHHGTKPMRRMGWACSR
jgi:hypothetical protein